MLLFQIMLELFIFIVLLCLGAYQFKVLKKSLKNSKEISTTILSITTMSCCFCCVLYMIYYVLYYASAYIIFMSVFN